MPAKETSVLFALDELRDIESQRQVELRHIAHKQAKERARVQAEEKRKREKEERDAVERRRLQAEQHELGARSLRILEAQIAADAKSISALQSRVRMHEAALSHHPAPEAAGSSRVHAAWGIALVAACAAVFLLANRAPEAAPAIASTKVETTPAPAIVPALDCPEPAPAAEPVVASESAEAAPARTSRSDRRRGKRDRGPKKPPPSQGIKIDGCMDDPLGCMPE